MLNGRFFKVFAFFLLSLFFVYPAIAQQSPAETDSPDMEQSISSMGVDPASSNLESLLTGAAAGYGGRVDQAYFNADELEPVRIMEAGIDIPDMTHHNSGYMNPGMTALLPSHIAANLKIEDLFKRYGALRINSGISLPSEFGPLVNYIKGYILANSKPDTEKKNGITNQMLATQIVRASFCFGNDPLMIVSKIRQETSFSRTEISSGGAVGWSQMTGMGIKEVQDQMSGNSQIAMPNARRSFQTAIRCFSGLDNYNVPAGNRVAVQTRLRDRWGMDLVFGQIMMKAYVSYTKAFGKFGDSVAANRDAYQTAFEMYNGDKTPVIGRCLKGPTIMKIEYGCSVISFFSRLSAQWERFFAEATGQDLS